jgi:hypothetical protein
MASPPAPTCQPWTTPAEVRACCGGLSPSYDLTTSIQYASEILYRLSGRQFSGLCERTLRPCMGDNCGCRTDAAWGALAASGWHWAMWPYPSSPVRLGGGLSGWTNCWGCGEDIGGDGSFDAGGLCAGACDLPCVTLPAPISNVLEVVVNGVALPSSAYKVEAYRRLCRVDGGHWPCSNNLRGESVVNTNTVGEYAVDATAGAWQMNVTVAGTAQSFTLDATDTAASVQAMIEAVYGVGTVVVAGGPADFGATQPYVVEWNVVALGAVPELTGVVNVSLSGGDTDTVVMTVVEPGALAGHNTWHVTYEFGTPPPPGGRMAASVLACQIALNRCGGDGCVLPQRLQSITREGVSLAFADPLDFLTRGEVGIYEVDLWLNSVNPNKIMRRAAVYRADHHRPPTNFT